jgi:hypothetical protein
MVVFSSETAISSLTVPRVPIRPTSVGLVVLVMTLTIPTWAADGDTVLVTTFGSGYTGLALLAFQLVQGKT